MRSSGTNRSENQAPRVRKQRLELHGPAHVSIHVGAAGHHTGWNSINTCGLMGHQLCKVQSPDHNIILTEAVVLRWQDTTLSILVKGHNMLIGQHFDMRIRIATC